MMKTTIHHIRKRAENRCGACRCWVTSLVVCCILMSAGCASIEPQQQRLVSKPNMQFSDSVVFRYEDRLLTQFESASASFIGGQSGDCGSCVAGGAP